MATARFRITGVRGGELTKEELLRSTQVNQAMEVFSDHLAKSVGEKVYQRISRGDWFRSRNPRYDYYRTWLRYRFGSSRARTNLGGGRGPGNLNSPDYALPHPTDALQGLELLKFNFLVRALRRHAQYDSGGAFLMGPSKRRKNRSDAVSYVADVYNVSAALDRIAAIQKTFQDLKAKDAKTARDYLRRSASSFLNGNYDYNRFFRETRWGQRFMRHAELAAMRHQRNLMVLDLDHDYNDGLTKALKDITKRRAAEYRKLTTHLLRSGKLAGPGRIPSLLPTGGFKWGFQTGTLAKAWSQAHGLKRTTAEAFQFQVLPTDGAGRGRNPEARELTVYLQRNIRRQGGDPHLLTRTGAQEAAREALRGALADWSRLGIRAKGGL